MGGKRGGYAREREDEEKEEDDEDALFAVSDEDMEDEPVLEVGASRCADD